MFSFRNFMVSGLLFNSFQVNFCELCKIRVLFNFSACGYPVSLHHLLKRPFSSPLSILGSFIKY